MLDRDRILDIVDQAYAARQRGDKAALLSHFAPGADFRLVGQSRLMGGLPVGPADAAAAVAGLIDLFRFHRIDRLQVMIDGNTAMIRWAVETSCADGPCAETELCDIWTLDDEGRITSLVEFADTALIAEMLAEQSIVLA